MDAGACLLYHTTRRQRPTEGQMLPKEFDVTGRTVVGLTVA